MDHGVPSMIDSKQDMCVQYLQFSHKDFHPHAYMHMRLTSARNTVTTQWGPGCLGLKVMRPHTAQDNWHTALPSSQSSAACRTAGCQNFWDAYSQYRPTPVPFPKSIGTTGPYANTLDCFNYALLNMAAVRGLPHSQGLPQVLAAAHRTSDTATSDARRVVHVGGRQGGTRRPMPV